MIVLKWVFPVSLAVLAIVHLVSCWRGDDDLRKPTKVALMPVVALSYLAFARQPSIWVVAGLLFGCLGDLFLLWPLKKKFFALGTSSFFLGHVCYLIFIYTHYVIRSAGSGSLWSARSMPPVSWSCTAAAARASRARCVRCR